MRFPGHFALLVLLLVAGAVQARPSGPAALLSDAIGDHDVVLLGEMHGTREIPAITARLLTHYASTGPVLLALEANAADQAGVERFLDSAGAVLDKARLLAGEHWQEQTHDGRDSVAMFELLDHARRLRAAGARVSVVMFDVAGSGERDLRMANAIRAAVQQHPDARVLVLTGNVHAMTGDPPDMFSAEGEAIELPTPMGRHLSDLEPLSIVFRASAGDYWACQKTCGVQQVNGIAGATDQPRLSHSDDGDSWDMELLLPRFTASPPAVGRSPGSNPGDNDSR